MLKIIFRLLFIFLLGSVSVVFAQSDGFDLPTDLYILLNEGIVQRYGLGAEGATTVTPEGDFVVDFAVAPDGNWIAYRTEEGITLAYMPNPDQIRVLLETVVTADFPPLRQGGQTMAWSNDGAQLAYTTASGVRVAFNLGTNNVVFTNILTSPARHLAWSTDGTYLAIEVENNIWWIYQQVDNTMNLVGALPSSYGTVWQDDSRLIFAPQEGGLLILDLGNLNTQYILRSAGQRYFLPTFRADDSLIAFTSDDSDNPQANAVWTRMSVSGNVATIEEFSNSPTDIRGAMWGVGGESLIALRDDTMVLLVPNIGVVLPLPVGEVVAYGWGAERPPSAQGVVMSTQGFFRAPDIFGVIQVWQLPNDNTRPTPITTGEDDITGYAVNPQGSVLSFISQNQIWRVAIGEDGAEPIELTRRLPNLPQDLTFSPDESRLFFTTEGDDGGLWVVDSMGESAPELLLPNEDGANYRYVRFAPNVNALMVAIIRPERPTQYLFYDPTAQATLNIGNYTVAGWLPDGTVMGYISQSTGLAMLNSQLQALNLSQDPILPLTVWEANQTRMLDFQPITAERWQMITAQVVPYGTEKGVLLEYAGGVFSIKVELGTVIDPIISPDGLFVASLTRPNGLLIIHDLTTGERTLLQAPNGVHDFRWGGAEGKKFNEL